MFIFGIGTEIHQNEYKHANVWSCSSWGNLRCLWPPLENYRTCWSDKLSIWREPTVQAIFMWYNQEYSFHWWGLAWMNAQQYCVCLCLPMVTILLYCLKACWGLLSTPCSQTSDHELCSVKWFIGSMDSSYCTGKILPYDLFPVLPEQITFL